jgi:LPXTG-motif cell wall-anchored protein
MNLSKKALLLSFVVFASTVTSLTISENTSAAFSGANGKVMYSDYMPQQGALTSDMGTIDPDGQNQIASLLHSDYSWYLAPRYSADGTKITYTENFPTFGASDIFVANADGTNPVNISNITGFSPNQIPVDPAKHTHSGIYSSFNNTGDKVVFSETWNSPPDNDGDPANDPPMQCNLVIVNTDGTNRQQLTDNPNFCDTYPVFSPTSNEVAFLRYQPESSYEADDDVLSIQVIDVDSLAITSIVPDFVEGFERSFEPLKLLYVGESSDFNPSTIDWHPSGDGVLYRTIDFDQPQDGWKFMSADMNGQSQELTRLVPDFNSGAFFYTYHPQFTPDGKIIFQKQDINPVNGGPQNGGSYEPSWDIIIMNADGTNKQIVLHKQLDGGPAAFFSIMPSVQPLGFTGNPENPGPVDPTNPGPDPTAPIVAPLPKLPSTGQAVQVLLVVSGFLMSLAIFLVWQFKVRKHHLDLENS